MRPGTRMRSEMPWMAWRGTSSAMREPRGRACRGRSSVSSRIVRNGDDRVDGCPRRSARPCSGLGRRDAGPRTLNGLVTTAIVSAPTRWQASRSPARRRCRPAPEAGGHEDHVGPVERLDELVRVLEGRLAADVRIGPGASPLVSWRRSGSSPAPAGLQGCRSVFATTNSTPARPVRAMRFTALPPPPPTPITLMRAPARPSSASFSRNSSLPNAASRSRPRPLRALPPSSCLPVLRRIP